MKKLSKLTAQAAVAVSLLSVAAPTFASTAQASTIESSQTQSKLNLSTQKKLDPYVTVENSGSVINQNTKVATNDFTLSNDENSVVSLYI